ncbi:MAG: sigma-70 family RNA polymerase sigma factor [Kiritimatiellae bacterium]|nr:sigma-70 family RNA polymerase sigma factor [Kiritimatiellia bacterium]MDD5519180.1 sigma-70 family RNA polymerase sigma factor [Kiritimatiellia bacterium]
MNKDSHRDRTEKKAEAVICEYEGPLLRYAMQILGDNSLAQDAVEKAFIQLCKNRIKETDFPYENLSAELYRAVHNAAVGLIFRKKAVRDRGRKIPLASGKPEEEVMRIVRELDFKEQQIVIFKIFEQKSNLEISRITGMNEETIVILLYKSVIKIAARLKKAGLL